MKYLIEKENNKKCDDEKKIGINIINKTNINVNININNYNENHKKDELISNINVNNINSKSQEIHKIISDINDLKVYKGEKPGFNLYKEIIMGENNNKKRGSKQEDKPIKIIENYNKELEKEKEKYILKNEAFQIIDFKQVTDKEQIIPHKDKNIYDTFCIGIFISGLAFPIKLTSIIENSDNFISPCGHPQCSMFPSIEPSLLNTFINENSKNFQDLPQLVSNMCFPLGIKPCFGCKFIENKIENAPDPQKTQQTFFGVVKNEKNECYFLATLQYFIKMTFKDYIMKYKFNPVTYVIDKIKDINNKDKKFKNNMQTISNLLNNSYVLIPESISLISKYPFFVSMEKCLRCLISLQRREDMDNLINHLINEVPSPKKGYQIQFFIPRIEKPIILNHQYNKFLNYKTNNDMMNNNILSSSQINTKILLDKITIDNIIMIFQLLILEQKILFLGNDYQTLSSISFIFSELIYPLVWENPYVPILSTKTVRFLQSPVPFIMGIDEYLLKYAIKLKYISPSNSLGTDIIIFNLMTNRFISSKTLKKIHKKDIFKEYKLPIMPSKVREYIEKELKDVKKHNKNNKEIDQQIRAVFLKTMIMLMGDYNNFIFYTEDEIPLFNKDAFVQSHKEKSAQFFLGEMVKTQIFNQFLLNEKQFYTKNKNKLQKISNNINDIDDKNTDNVINYELVDTSYFKNLISVNQNLVNSEKIRSRALSTKKIKKIKKNKDKVEDFDINNYILNNKDDMDSNKIRENILEGNIGNGNHSIDFNKGKNKLSPNIDITEAFSEKNFDENPFEKMNNNKKMEKLMLRAKSAKRVINLNNHDDEKKVKKLNIEEIKIIVLYPYFLTKSTKTIDEITMDDIKTNIELYSKKNNFTFLLLNSEHVFIRHSYKFNNVTQKKLYLLPNNNYYNKSKQQSRANSIHNTTKTNKFINFFNEKNEIKLDNKIDKNQKDFEFIKSIFIKCYTNKIRITKSDLTLLKNIFLKEENKSFFAQLILPDIKMKKKKYHKSLTPSSFEDFSKMLNLSLEHMTSNEYNTCRLLTISSFVYYKIENKKLIYLYENLIRGIRPCRLWLFDEFWPNFFKLEFNEELKLKNASINLYQYDTNENDGIDNEQSLIEKEKEEVLFETISFTAEIMIKLKLSKELIRNTFEKKIFPEYEIDKDKANILMRQIFEMFDKL